MTRPDAGTIVRALFSRRLGALLFLGLAGGVAFDLVSFSGTLQLWLADTKSIPVEVISLFSLTTLPYILKPLWSPLLDRFRPPRWLARLGRRRGWMLIWLAGLTIGVVLMGVADPADVPWVLGVTALFVAFCSASFDIVNDAYRTELMRPHERGPGVALSSAGYRAGMLVAGGLAPVFAGLVGWRSAYLLMAGVLALGFLAAWWAPREEVPEPTVRPTLLESFVKPLVVLFTRKEALLLLGIVFVYKIGDSFGSSLYGTFLTRGLGFDSAEIGPLRKAIGVPSIFVGMILGGILMARLRLYHALLAFGVLQAGTNVLLVFQAQGGASYEMLAGVLVFENIAGGMGNIAFVMLITLLCDVRFSGTHFALMAALAQLGRFLCGLASGPVASGFHWHGYFWISVYLAVPGILLVLAARKSLLGLDAPRPSVEETFG